MAIETPNKTLIANAIKSQLDNILDFGVPRKFAAIISDKIRLNITDFKDAEIPAVQIIDVSTLELPERARGHLSWQIVCQIVLKERKGFSCDQEMMWLYEQMLKECIMNKPDLGLFGANALPYSAKMIHLVPTDRSSDLHTFGPYYVANVGFSVLYYEPLTRRTP
jgi:hypothetical protein